MWLVVNIMTTVLMDTIVKQIWIYQLAMILMSVMLTTTFLMEQNTVGKKPHVQTVLAVFHVHVSQDSLHMRHGWVAETLMSAQREEACVKPMQSALIHMGLTTALVW